MIKKELSKMTKKERREYYNQFRNTWKMNPVTRKNKNAKIYDRKKFRSMKDDFQNEISFFILTKNILNNFFSSDTIVT